MTPGVAQNVAISDAMQPPAPLPDLFNPDGTPAAVVQPPGPFMAGVRSGLYGLKAAGAGALAAGGEALGLPAVQQFGLQAAQAANTQAAEGNVAPAFSSDYIKYMAGQGLPYAASGLLASKLGGLGARALAKEIPDEAVRLAAENMGAHAALAGGIAAQEVGSIYPAAVQAGVPDPLARSVIGGVVATGAMMVPGEMLVNRFGMTAGLTAEKIAAQRAAAIAAGETTFGGTTLKSLAGGLVQGTLEQGAATAAGMTAQTAVTRAVLNKPLTGPEANTEYLNSAAAGFAGSLIPGALSGLVSGVHPAGRIEQPPAPAPETAPPAPETTPIAPVEKPSLATAPEGSVTAPEVTPKTHLFDPPILGEQTAPKPSVSDIITPEQHEMLTLAERQAQDAISTRNIETGVQPERENGVRGGQAAEAGAGNRVLGEAQGGEQPAGRGAESVETQLALIKRSRGLLLTSDEVKAANAYAKQAPAVEPVTSSSRGATPQPGPQAARDNFMNAFTAGAEKAVAERTDWTEKKQTTIKSALNAIAEQAIKAKTPEEAKAILDSGIEKVLNRKMPADEAQIFRERLSDQVVAEHPPVIDRQFSKAAEVNPNPEKVVFTHWGNVLADRMTEPGKIGTGEKGADQAAAKAVGLDYTSAVVRGSKYTEPAVQAKQEHVGVLDASKIYQFNRDDPLLAQAREQVMAQHGPNEQIAQMQYAKNVRDAGFDAMQYPNGQLRIFTPQEVHKAFNDAVIAKVADHAMAAHEKFGGSSNNLVTGQDLSGTINYAVSPFKDRELIIPGTKVDAATLRQYAKINNDLLSDPRNILGTWVKNGNTYVDVSTVTGDYAQAMRIAAENNQEAIHNLRTHEDIPTGTPFDPSGVMSASSAARFNGIMISKASDMLKTVKQLVGEPKGLEVRLTSGGGDHIGMTYFGSVKDFIEMSVSAKDGNSLAAHESYHWLEGRVLEPNEQSIVARAFKSGTALYDRLVEQAKIYDKTNGTDITRAIIADPKEARAYGFEMWRRGELEAPTFLGRVWQKLTRVMERVANAVHGLGFQSSEDIFHAIDQSAYANRKANPLSGYLAPAFAETDQSRANQQALADFRAGRNPDFLFSQAAQDLSLEEAAQRMAAGELSHMQFNSLLARAIDDKGISRGLRDKIVDPTIAQVRAVGGSVQRFLDTWVHSGENLSHKSIGFKNAFNVVTAFGNRKSVLIADMIEKRLSTWIKGAATQDEKAVVSKALLERTVGNYLEGSQEYQTLRSNLTEKQRGMFDQGREMLDYGLDQELKSDSVTYRKLLGDDAVTKGNKLVVEDALRTKSDEGLTDVQRDMFNKARTLTPGSEAYRALLEPDNRYNRWLADRTAKVDKMKAEGYFPLKRYGDHVVYGNITTPNGDRVTAYQANFDSEAQAKLHLADLQRTAGDQGIDFNYGYKYKAQHDGTQSFGQFLTTAERAGVVLTQAEKERIGEALISADSAMRNRIFRRENIAGYSDNGMRVLAEFGINTANKIAFSELGDAVKDAAAGKQTDVTFDPQGQAHVNTIQDSNLWKQDGDGAGFYHNLLDRTVDFAMSPKSTTPLTKAMRQVASINFIGGSLSGGFVNMCSLPMIAVPWLSQHTSYYNSAAKVLGALRLSIANYKTLSYLPALLDATRKLPGIDEIDGLRHALQVAAQDGTNQAAETYNAMGLSRGAEYSMSGRMQKAVSVWMTPFQTTETLNRLSTFIAGYKIAKENGLDNTAAYKLAQEAVHGSQFRYDDANLPAFARNDIGRLLFTFKSFNLYSIETLAFLAKENPRAAAFMAGSILAASGTQGMPFAEDAENLIDSFSANFLGSPFNSRRWIANIMKDASEFLPGHPDLSSVMLHGIVNNMTDLNVASRVGYGHMIPGSMIGVPGADYKAVLSDILGPVGSQAAGVLNGVRSVTHGEFVQAARQALPLAAQNLTKGILEWNKGYATDIQGRRTVDISRPESLWQMAGFSSNAAVKANWATQIDNQQNAFYQDAQKEFEGDIVRDMQKGDMTSAKEKMAFVSSWNTHHPDMSMQISGATIMHKAQQAGMTATQRELMKLPKALRPGSESYQSYLNEANKPSE